MSQFGTLTIMLEFCKRRDQNSTWGKTSTLLIERHILLDAAREIAQDFKTNNEPIREMLIITWQADPVFLAGGL